VIASGSLYPDGLMLSSLVAASFVDSPLDESIKVRLLGVVLGTQLVVETEIDPDEHVPPINEPCVADAVEEQRPLMAH